jgi:two-component sensor histidine kinase
MMARELDHRVKNNLATVLSIAEQTGTEAGGFDEFRSKFAARIRAMARVHEQLAATHWAGTALEALLDAMLAPFSVSAVTRVVAQGPLVSLTASAASALSLVFHELGDNAAKHGALSTPEGSVRIRWAVRLEKDLRIVWEERGGPGRTAPSETGFGMRLVHGLVSHELGGAVDVRYVGTDMTCEMTLPAEHFSVERPKR